MVKYPVTSRTRKSSPLAATIVPGKLGAKIAKCASFFSSSSLLSVFPFVDSNSNACYTSKVNLMLRVTGKICGDES